MGRLTIRDVARAAGVHPATAFRALNPRLPGRISAETTQRVVQAAAELGYVVDAAGRSLRTRRSATIGVLVPDLLNPFYPPLLRGVGKALRHAGFEERLFHPMGIDHAEWDRVASGAVFGFHGLHLTTEAVAAFGELLLRAGAWGDRQLVPREWVDLATRKHIDTQFQEGDLPNPDALVGYGYQFWMSRHGYRGQGAYGQLCVVVPSHDLVIAVTCDGDPHQELPGALWDLLLPGLDGPGSARDDEILAERLRRLSLAPVLGSADPERSVKARLDASDADSALPDGTTVIVDPVDGGWLLRFGAFLDVEVGYGEWRESSPLGRPVVAAGAWQGNTFVADLYVITTPHRVRLVLDARAGTAVATWRTVPLTGPGLELHLRSPLMTRPDVA